MTPQSSLPRNEVALRMSQPSVGSRRL
jgi:hypothetical protein